MGSPKQRERTSEIGASKLADVLHDVRVRVRKTLAQWSAEGTYATLVDVRLVSNEYSRSDEALNMEVRITCLDDRLKPGITAIDVSHPDELDTQLARLRPVMDLSSARQAALARQGGDGMVDQLVLNAHAQYGDVADMLRQFASGWGVTLSEALTIFMYDGHVQCHGWDPSRPQVHWSVNRVTIHGKSAPSTVLNALAGKPISALIKHPVLTEDMVITNAFSKYEHGEHSVRAEFDQRQWVFCGASGRVWLPGD